MKSGSPRHTFTVSINDLWCTFYWPHLANLTSDHLCFLLGTSNWKAAMLNFAKIAVPLGLLILRSLKLQITSHPDGGHFGFCQYGGPWGARQKSKRYGMGDLWAKFGAFVRIWTKISLTPLTINPTLVKGGLVDEV